MEPDVKRRVKFILSGVALAAVSAQAVPPDRLALEGGRIIPVVGEPIASGTILFEHGRITAIGASVDIPYDAMVVDVSGKVVFPGMVDAHSASGLDVPNENLPVTPYLDVYDALDPSRLYFEDALRDGITSIHVIVANNCAIGGISRVVHPIGLTPDEMTQQTPVAMKLSTAPKNGFDRMVQMATLREAFLELADYQNDLAERKYEESLEKEKKKIDVSPDEARKLGRDLIQPEDYDDKHRNLNKLARGQLGAFVYCQLPSDVGRAVKLARDHGFFDRMVLVPGPACFKAVAEIKATGRPVVLDAELLYREQDPVTGEISETFVPKVYADAGVAFSLLPSPDQSLAERYLNYQAARCVRHGIEPRTALESITLQPARALGMGDRIGSLEVGKVANVVVFSGDPLDFNSWVDLVYINGIKAYDRTTDVRLKQLFGEEPKDVSEAGSPREPTNPAMNPSNTPAGAAPAEKSEK